MTKGIDLTENFVIRSHESIKQICKPLYDHFKINYFNYVKLYKDGGRVLLSDRPDWMEYFYKHSLYRTKVVAQFEHLSSRKFFSWLDFIDQPSFQIGREMFDIDNGITMVLPFLHFSEIYYFGTNSANKNMNQFYLQNLDVFTQFTSYFKDIGNKIIKEANKDVIYLPTQVDMNENDIYIEDQNHLRNKLLENIKVKRYYLYDKYEDVYLTKAEIVCYYHLLQGLTAKHIARLINCSYRTVETHINSIKRKLNCRLKSELLIIASKLHLDDFLEKIYPLL